jgi:hypothetical protein
MSETQKLLIAIVGVFVVGFIWVGAGKEEDTSAGAAQKSQLITYAAMQQMANQKCPREIKERTKSELFFPTKTESDKDTYVTLIWNGEKDDNFKTASCTMRLLESGIGISKLVIDDQVIIDREKK